MSLVTVLGNTNSGCGAIYEYLIGREDTIDPVNKLEFRLLSDPGGINDLYSVYNNFSLQNYNFKLKNLIEIGKLYSKKRSFISEGLNLSIIKNYNKYWKEYLKSIKGFKYKHRYIYDDIKKSKLEILSKRIINRLSFRNILFKDYWTGVTKREFEIHTFKFFKNIFQMENNKKLVILNQCGNFWDPIESTKLIGEPKIIMVKRNPLDQFAELKKWKGMHSSKEFINWFIHLKKMESTFDNIDERILNLNFEDFVLDHENGKNKVCKHLNIDNRVNSNYEVSKSMLNIGKFRKILTNEEIQLIKMSLNISNI
tara:strand:- start:8259 stop:9191 length:933 start_codon:yes stop_codon:yes gene_type:complete